MSSLRNLLPEEALREFAILEARMMENLHRQRLYGSANDAERFEIVDALNQLAWQYQAKSFTELCFHPQLTKVTPSTVPSPHTEPSISETRQSLKKVVSPKAAIQFFTHVLPTAYYHLLSTNDFPFFLVTIDNSDPDSDDATVIVSAFIEDYSDLARTMVTIAKGERKDVTLLPVLKHSVLTTLTETRKTTLHISVQQISPHTKDIENKTWMVRLLARNQALLAMRGEDQRVVDLTRYLVAWVTPNHPEMSRVLHSARDYHSDKELRGYQDGDTIDETAASVREQTRYFLRPEV